MKWVNGLTWEEKKRRRKEWHRWFAWHPVIVGYTKIRISGVDHDERAIKAWLQWVERSGEYWSSWSDSGWDWTYREIK